VALRVVAVALCALAWISAAHAQPVVPATPSVQGPITGPEPMHPGMRPGPEETNLADFGYVVDEYFVSGTAGPAAATYKVRVLVWRPADPAKFSGVVVYEPTHQGGNALICQFARFGIAHRGHACVTVSAQAVVLTSTTVNPANPRGIGLYIYNPERYGTLPNAPGNPLLHVNNNQSNEVLAQIAWLIKSNNAASPLPAAYPVNKLVMGGTSASSGFTRSYMGGVHNSVFRSSNGGPIVDAFLVTATLGSAPVEITDVPTIQVPTQFEVAGTNAYRRPDSDLSTPPVNLFRIYEVPGMSHNDSRDQPPEVFPGCVEPLSRYPYGASTFMALQKVIDWAVAGTLPPHANYIEVNAGPPRAIVFDEQGNAKGGVRTPHLDVPVARYIAPNTNVPGTLCNQSGREERFSDEVLRGLYGPFGQSEYLSRFEQRLQELITQGWWPAEYAERYARADAKAFKVLPPDLLAAAPAVSPAVLFQGSTATFSALVTNAAPDGAAGVKVRFLVDGVPVGEQTIAQLAAGSSTTVSAQWSATPGMHSVEVRLDPDDAIAELNEANNTAAQAFEVRNDLLAPSSVAAVSPAANAAGWYRTSPTVTLTATDDSAGSGVRSISYRLNGGPAVTVNGASASVVVSSEGVNQLSYSATDNVGNVEAARTLVVRIDATAPAAKLSLLPGVLRPDNHKLVRIHTKLFVASDLSGPVSVGSPVVTSNEPQTGLGRKDVGPDWVVKHGELYLRAERGDRGKGRIYTVTYTLTDRAGNSSQVSDTVTVPLKSKGHDDDDDDDDGDRRKKGQHGDDDDD
jgi:Alpha/beta hydrolase domain/CARDB